LAGQPLPSKRQRCGALPARLPTEACGNGSRGLAAPGPRRRESGGGPRVLAKTTPDLFVFDAGVLRCGTGPGSSRTPARLGPSRLGEQTRAEAGGVGATARSGSTKTPFCNMPRFLRTMSPLLLRGLRPLVTGNPRRRWGLDLVRSRPQRAPQSALSRRQSTTPLPARFPVFMGYCGVHSAEFGPVWAGDLGRSGAAAPTALASWHPNL